jgi:hypothetical protein
MKGYAAILLLACAVSTPVQALSSIDLGDGNSLLITTDKVARTATVTLKNNGDLTESITLGNAGVDDGAAKAYKFCGDCTAAYFVPVYDLTSTYGATTGIVVWEGGWWSLTALPLSVANVEGPDKRGVYWLTDTSVIDGKASVEAYWFDSGFLMRR